MSAGTYSLLIRFLRLQQLRQLRDKTVEYETLLAFELANGESDDIVELNQDGELELDELMREVFLLEMDTKNLCSESPGCWAKGFKSSFMAHLA